MLYKRIASTPSREELDELKVEMIDRFGPVPPFTQSLFRATYLKLRAAALGIRKIDAGASSGYILFEEQNQIDPKRVLKLIQGNPKEYRLDGPLEAEIRARRAHRGSLVYARGRAGGSTHLERWEASRHGRNQCFEASHPSRP